MSEFYFSVDEQSVGYQVGSVQITIGQHSQTRHVERWSSQLGWQGGTSSDPSWGFHLEVEPFRNAVERLGRQGSEVHHPVPEWVGYWSFPVKDPMGNTVEISATDRGAWPPPGLDSSPQPDVNSGRRVTTQRRATPVRFVSGPVKLCDVAIVWWEVETPAPGAFQEFHAAMWGWTFQSAFEDSELSADYWIVSVGGRSIGGLQRSPTGQTPSPGVRLYLAVGDLEDSLQRVVTLGAVVERERTALGGEDRWFATIADPSGVSFGLWTANAARSRQ